MVLFNLLKRKERYHIGIDIGHSGLKVTVLVSTGDGMVLEKCFLNDFPSWAIVDGRVENERVVVTALRNLIKRELVPKGKVISTVIGGGTEVNRMRLPLVDSKDLDRYVAMETERVFSLPMTALTLDYSILKKDKEHMDVLAVGVPRGKVSQVGDLFERAGLDLHVLEVKPLALYHLFTFLGGDKYMGVNLVVDVGKNTTTVLLMKNGELVCARETQFGGDAINEAIQREETVTYEQAEKLKKKGPDERPYMGRVTGNFITSLGHELRLVLDKCRVLLESGEGEVERVFFTGGATSLENFAKVFEEMFDVKVKNVYDLKLQGIAGVEDMEALDRYSVSLGLAIRGALA